MFRFKLPLTKDFLKIQQAKKKSVKEGNINVRDLVIDWKFKNIVKKEKCEKSLTQYRKNQKYRNKINDKSYNLSQIQIELYIFRKLNDKMHSQNVTQNAFTVGGKTCFSFAVHFFRLGKKENGKKTDNHTCFLWYIFIIKTKKQTNKNLF